MTMAFDAGEDFARDKPALVACHNLDGTRCRIHDQLAAQGYPGCARYECLGAGQRVLAEVLPGADWQRDPALRAPLAEAFGALRRVHAGLELLLAAESLPLPASLAAEHAALRALYHPAAGWNPASLRDFAASGLPNRLSAFLRALRACL